MPNLKEILITAVVLCAGAAGAMAHHSYAAFDMNKEVSISGTVKEFKFANPHVSIVVTHTDPVTGNSTDWFFEAASTRGMAMAGWRRSTLEVGGDVTIVGHPLRDGKPGASMVHAVLPDGTILKASAGSNY